MTSTAPVGPDPHRSPAGVVASRAAIGFFSGTVGLVDQDRLPRRLNALAALGGGRLLADGHWISAGLIALATVAIDLVYLGPWQRTVPLKFLVPGTIFLVGFQVVPLDLERQHRVHELVDRAQPHPARGDRRDRGELAHAAADGATYTMAPARQGRRARPAARRRGTGKAYAGTKDGLDAARSGRRHDRERHDHRGGGLHDRQGPGPAHDRRGDGQAPRPDRRHVVRPGGGAQPGGRAAADAEVRRGERDVFVNLDTKDVYGDNGEGSYVSASGEVLEPGLAHPRRLQELQTPSSPTRSCATRSSGSSSGHSSTPALSVFLTFSLGLFLAIMLNKPDLRLQRLQRAAARDPVRDPRVPLGPRLGRAAQRRLRRRSTTCSGSHVPWLFDPTWARSLVHPRQPLARRSPTSSSSARAPCRRFPRSSPRLRASTARRRARCSGRSRCRCSSSRPLRS